VGWLLTAAQVPQSNTHLSNLRKRTIAIKQNSVQLDTLSIVPGTVTIPGVPDSLYTIDFANARLTWKQRPALDTISVRYRVFHYRLNAVVNRMQYDSIINFFGQPFIPDYAGIAPADNFFNFGNINYNGSFGRAISFGNSQDAVLTSNLNLQLSGYLADSIEIVAAITDNNLPIQPDGTTQQLNEFDRIFLQFRKKNWQLSLGDIDIRQQQSYFLSFYKRLQGAAFETTSAITDSISNKTMISGSIAKGKFTRNVLTPQEGNQGPYRLQGANNETYFVVLANTERVYIDGVLMQRGEDRDYVINYNTAEVTFTPRQMVTKDKRIVVEFEYADRNYLNSNIYLTNETNFNQKVKLRFGYFSNADAKSSPINQTLDASQKLFLKNLGDSVSRAYYPYAAAQDTFSTGAILYKKIDTVYNGGTHDSVFVYTTNTDSARYQLSFLDVGANGGNYVIDLNGVNGKVYRWVAPVNGQKQGNYEPAVFLVTPKKQQVVNLGVEYNINRNTVLNTEVAMSNYDVNTFSDIDKGNDKGYAAKVDFKNVLPFKSSKRGLRLTSAVGYEYVDARFKPLERLRNVEFTRDWGLPLQTTVSENENIVTASAQLSDRANNSLQYQFTEYNRGTSFVGVRNSVTHMQTFGGWALNNQFSLSNVSGTDQKGYFWRPTVNVSRRFAKLWNYTLGGTYSVEHNAIQNKLTDSMASQSFSFNTTTLYLKSDAAKPNRWGITWFTRTNSYPLGKELVKADRSQNVSLTAELLKNTHHQFRFTSTYRKLQILDSSLNSQLPEESLLGRAEYQASAFKGVLNGNLLYEVGAGQEQKRDYSYLEVQAGQGEYTWIDYNGNGIQELNEFEVAQFQDQAKYIRIFTPTNVYVKASYNTFNYSVNINPRAAINPSTAKGARKFISKLNMQSSLQISKKEVANNLVQFNPFKQPLTDTSLITLTSNFINTFSFNRYSPKWGFDVTNALNTNKSLLTYGYESHKLNNWTLRTRLNFTRVLAFDVTGQAGINQLITSNPKFDNRNYKINQYSVEPHFTVTRGNSFRMGFSYKYSDKNNEQGSQEKSLSNSLSTDIKYNILQSSSITAKFTYNNITFSSMDSVVNTSSTSAYIILEGLQPGKNYLWTLDLTKRLSNNLEFSMQYEGRKPGTSRIVHVGRAAIRALL
jgi:hypothetical protein